MVAAFAAGAGTVALGYWMLLPVVTALVAFAALSVWRRRRVGTISNRIPTLTPNVALIALPTALSAIAAITPVSLSFSAFLLILTAGIAFAMRRPSTGSFRMDLTWSCAALPVLALAIVLRPNFPTDTFDLLYFVVGCLITTRAVCLSESKSSAVISLIDGVGLFVVVSIGLWLVGVTGTADRTEGLGNSLTGGMRAIFPLSVSLAATPAMASVYITAVVPVIMYSGRYRFFRLVAAVCAVSVIILSDSRVSLLGSAFVCACVLLLPRMFRRVAPWLVGVAMIVPFIYEYVKVVFGQVMTAASSYAPWIIRPDEEASTLAGRDQIWSRSIDFYEQRVDWLHQMIGHGTYGQSTSGASSYYSEGFEGFANDLQLVTPHSSTLQILFDGGWLVGVAVLVTMVRIAWVLARGRASADLAGLSMLVALSIVGVSEVALSPSNSRQQPTWWVLVALSIIVFIRQRSVTPDEPGSEKNAPTPLDGLVTNRDPREPNAVAAAPAGPEAATTLSDESRHPSQ
ncbi:O-antigen ligase family protein [Mycobacterium hodleri]|uniref:O-antigen ligase family protein n=1 Tax=Mycolicibacterium hodleri TaxID=49897 RepID=UPI0021F29D1C|nr:O-antigen ligase family protein [Mycolicibacterium hodleri]MCV7136620.1 O-antigen ligase family protein [Mycolicibacterium hodleri]